MLPNSASSVGGPISIKSVIADVLRSERKRRRYTTLLACMAVVVAFGVAIVLLLLQCFATTRTVQVLDCPVKETVAHTHDASCYDASRSTHRAKRLSFTKSPPRALC